MVSRGLAVKGWSFLFFDLFCGTGIITLLRVELTFDADVVCYMVCFAEAGVYFVVFIVVNY